MTIPKRCPDCRGRIFPRDFHICPRPDEPKKAPRRNQAGELRPKKGLTANWID